MKTRLIALIVTAGLTAQPAMAGVCDLRPSVWLGSGGSSALTGITGLLGGAGAAGKAAGLYTLTHYITGATMLGSTAGGASAAGTVGIMGGTAGTGAAVMGVVLNPFVWVPAMTVAVGTAALEGGCYISGK